MRQKAGARPERRKLWLKGAARVPTGHTESVMERAQMKTQRGKGGRAVPTAGSPPDPFPRGGAAAGSVSRPVRISRPVRMSLSAAAAPRERQRGAQCLPGVLAPAAGEGRGAGRVDRRTEGGPCSCVCCSPSARLLPQPATAPPTRRNLPPPPTHSPTPARPGMAPPASAAFQLAVTVCRRGRGQGVTR